MKIPNWIYQLAQEEYRISEPALELLVERYEELCANNGTVPSTDGLRSYIYNRCEVCA